VNHPFNAPKLSPEQRAKLDSDVEELNRELEAMAAETLADEPDYDWGDEGPPK
jgi:hypothetical protein